MTTRATFLRYTDAELEELRAADPAAADLAEYMNMVCDLAEGRVVDVVAGLLLRDAEVWLAQRHPSPLAEWSEAWCAAGGKVEPGESPKDALVREWDEEAGILVVVGACVADKLYRTPGYARTYRVRTYVVTSTEEPHVTPAGGQRGAWWPLTALPEKHLRSLDDALAGLAARA